MKIVVTVLLFSITLLSLQTTALGKKVFCQRIVEDHALIESLKRIIKNNNAVFLFRHTNKGAYTDRDCKEQTQALTECGKDQAALLNLGVKQLKLDVATVVSSNYCRTIETGEIIFGPKNIVVPKESKDKFFGLGSDVCTRAILKNIIKDVGNTQHNAFLFSHSNCLSKFITNSTGREEAEGLAVVFNIEFPSNPIGCIWRHDWVKLVF